jgi:tetratricopeptide (TPR) repeat protein
MEDFGMRRPVFLSTLVVALAVAGPLFAAGGGGGGGGGSMPSSSGPQYDPVAEYQKGIAALQAKEFKAAKTAFDHVLASAPRDANTNYLAGLSRSGLGDWKGAKKFLEKATKYDPNMTAAWRELGVAYAKLGDRPNAEATLAALQAKVTACADTCPTAGELKTAVDAVAAALSGAPTASLAQGQSLLFAGSATGDSLYLDAVALINDRRYEDAIAALKSAQASFGPHPDILTYLGFANRKLKRFDVAESYYLAALAVAPTHRGATEYYGELMVERGDLAGAKLKLAALDSQCRFGCAEAEELRLWIAVGHSPHS